MSFVITVGLHVTNDCEYQRYREAMMPILKSFGGNFGFDFKVSEVLKSKTDEPINRVFTIEFPSKTVMEEYFSNPKYIEVKNKHFNNCVQSITDISMHETIT